MSHSKGDTNLTLLIRHMPREFSDSDRLDFLQHFGAVSVRSVCIGGGNNEAVFATFSTPSAAKAALIRLHQMEVLGCHLSVEYSHSVRPTRFDPQMSSLDNRADSQPEEDNRQRLQDQFMRRLVSWSSKLNLPQPPPSHLHYQYPPPTPATLSNISRALSMHPRLYTQLLHLMNRMNLPPPFQTESKQRSTCNQETQTEIIWVQKSSSESEMESEEEQILTQPKATLHKRPLPRRQVRPIKRPMFIKPPATSEISSSSNTKPEEVFEKPETCMLPKKIEVRLGGSLQLEKEESEPLVSLAAHDSDDQGGFGVMHPPNKPIESLDKEEGNDSDCLDESGCVITAEQLASNRVPQKDLQILPVFKKYSPGVPSCRLYVKNISKHAVARDLHFIYRRYSKVLEGGEESNINMFDVRLMTEGRMKGQAFITLPTVTLAEQALLETNGYILKDKPLVVQFARSAPALPTPSST